MSDKDDIKPLDHDYDGIQEYDHPLPMWWLITFLGTIIFGYIYWVHYESGSAPTQIQELNEDLREIEKRQVAAPSGGSAAPTDEATVLAQLLQSHETLESGQAVFAAKCLPCHGASGEGGIGPNLTDDYWITGKGRAVDIASTVRKGVLDKGMPAWETMMNPDQIRAVVVYVASIRGSKPANPKAPQGEMVGP